MSSEHSREHEERLRAVVCGDLDPSAVEACTTCCERLDELGRVASLLDGDAEEERRVLHDARTERDRQAPVHVATFLRARFAQGEGAPPRAALASSNPLPWIAAAAVVIGLCVWIATRVPGRPVQIPLGSVSLECLEPHGAVPDYREFTWRGTLPPGGWYEIDVYGGDNDLGARIQAAHLEESRWSPTDAQRSALPPKIRWTVRTVDATGSRVESCTGSASLSR